MTYEEFIKEIDEQIAKLDEKIKELDEDENEDEYSDLKHELTITAHMARLTFDAFIAEGFTEAQAMKLTALFVQKGL